MLLPLVAANLLTTLRVTTFSDLDVARHVNHVPDVVTFEDNLRSWREGMSESVFLRVPLAIRIRHVEHQARFGLPGHQVLLSVEVVIERRLLRIDDHELFRDEKQSESFVVVGDNTGRGIGVTSPHQDSEAQTEEEGKVLKIEDLGHTDSFLKMS